MQFFDCYYLLFLIGHSSLLSIACILYIFSIRLV